MKLLKKRSLLKQNTLQLLLFPDVSSPLPDSFPLESYKYGHQHVTVDPKANIRSIFEKLQLNESHKCVIEWWNNFFFGFVTDSPNSLPEIKPFKSKISFSTTIGQRPTLSLPIDDGIRNLDVVTQLSSMLGGANEPFLK